eukprot:GHUV01040940.1.p1 GENE.GHUV01040940.1~~GHUV01040940.1.p1  ORF type:complete len:604 (+),score=248.82 GHUV01040940.1:79-1890(+)
MSYTSHAALSRGPCANRQISHLVLVQSSQCRACSVLRKSMASFSGFGGTTGGFSFGASSAAATGASSAPAFGFAAPASSAPASTPAYSFGGGGGGGFSFGGASQPASAAASQPAASSAPAFSFGGLGATAGSSTPAFGAPSSAAASTPTSTPSFFGATSSAAVAPAATPAFGAPAASAPAFGAPGASAAASGSTPSFSFAAGSTPASSAAPAAAGGFTLGGASSAAAPSAAAPAASNAPAAAPAFGGFGAATSSLQPAAAAGSVPATSAHAAAPTFSFAPPASSAAAASAPASAPASAAAGTAAAALVPLPASSSAAAVGSAASAGAATPAAPKVPNQLAGKTLEDIITGWQQELEKHSVSFVAQARTLAAWDSAVLSNRHTLLNVEQELRAVHAGQQALERQLGMIETHQKEVHDSLVSIEAEAERMYANERTLMDADTQDRDSAVLSNRHTLLNVEQELRAVHAGQQALERQLGMIETHQKEVHDSLVSIEAEAERMYANERTLMDADTQDRDRLYARAQAVSTALGSLATELTRSVDQVNELAAASLGDPSTPMGSVVRVLNGQLQALSQLECRIEELNGQIDNLKLTVPMLSGGMIKAA